MSVFWEWLENSTPFCSMTDILLFLRLFEAQIWKYFVFSSPSIANFILERIFQWSTLDRIARRRVFMRTCLRLNSGLESCLCSSIRSRKEITYLQFASARWRGSSCRLHDLSANLVFLRFEISRRPISEFGCGAAHMSWTICRQAGARPSSFQI